MSTHTFYLFRHGETDWNKEKKFQGHSNIPLNLKGVKQAETLVSVFNNLDVKRVISSDLDRALNTAKFIVEIYGLELHTDQRLRETFMGEIEGKTADEVNRIMGRDVMSIWRSMRDDSFDFAFPGGETKRQVRTRASKALLDWAEKYPDENLAISAHGGVVRLLLSLTDNDSNNHLFVSNCAVYELQYNKKEDRWRSSFENLNHKLRD